MAGRAYAYDEEKRPFSQWKAVDKFVYIMREKHPGLYAAMTCEYQFDEKRKWRFDLAWIPVAVAVEVDGFGWGHQAQQGMSKDNEKANRGVELGWRIFRYNSRDLGGISRIEDAVDQVAAFIILEE